MQVAVVDFVSWLTSHFNQDDYVFVKMDIEGAEFSVLKALMDSGKACLVDILAFECHQRVGNCNELKRQLAGFPCIKLRTEGVGYDVGGYMSWDHFSSPAEY